EFNALWILDWFLTVDQVQVHQCVEFLTVAAASAATTIASTATSTAATSTSALVIILLVIVVFLWRTNLTANSVTLAQAKALDHGHRNIDVVRARQVTGGANKGVVI